MSRTTKQPATPTLAPAITRHVREAFVAARRGVSVQWHHTYDVGKEPANLWTLDLDTNPHGHATVKIRRAYIESGRTEVSLDVTEHMDIAEVHQLAHMLTLAAERLGTMTPADDWQDYPPKG